ncbi:hypothetical protein P280DRAFT_466223 [Massarina eburnea CBS 473.64]|uniref:RING-CH-type domain-containing protein n=1 Tax=Massarina eburnea CBS 473.64 TaxID=1395130 RepID=A0A6A6SE37_9PLEO|nr:hypothetical protein P280DRAFT_466223 [Massarina eburnea CBS 473.64]
MASLPPQRPASQRRASPPAESSSEHAPARRNSFSAASVDSQTVLLNSPPSQNSKPAEPQTEAPAQAPAQPPPQSDEDVEPRKCWICFNDETEDDENTSEWRSPCPCVLVAHERCLLDWIADMEAPNSRRRAGGNAGKILCPQCKGEIKLQRPKSITVELVRLIERLTGMMLIPGFLFVTSTAAYTTLRLSGIHTIYEIFGQEDGVQILAPLYQAPTVEGFRSTVAQRLFHRLRHHWRLDLGLPIIPTMLIASRTTLADSFLPLLPLVFFASSDAGDELLKFSWPPSAAFTIATLPYVRGLYNAYYDKVWLPRERRWLKEIQPRAGEDEPNRGAEHNHVDNILDALADEDEFDRDERGNDVLEVEVDLEIDAVDFDIFAGWNNGGDVDNNQAPENPPVPIARGPGAPDNALPQNDDEPPPLIDANGQPQEDANANAAHAPAPNIPLQPAEPRRPRPRRERNGGLAATVSLADAILGALVFPSIAAAVGEALKHALPKSWITPPSTGKPTGFLQARWGRSIVGGCLFVGIKDAVYLYVRWKMAQNHRRRSVLDYDQSKGKKKGKA